MVTVPDSLAEIYQKIKPHLEQTQQLIEKVSAQIYQRLSPEKQFAFCLIATYLYPSIILEPENLPSVVQSMLELLDILPAGRTVVWISLMITAAGTIDGARRILSDQLPLYKAYIEVFLLQSDSQE